ncbi:MAG: Arc family DNA-binding protein [Anaerolineales bacterium]|nr:Arc family DNA-binding protein [Anaerolineales bacterium]
MATVTLKNIPDDLYELLKRSAEVNRRSINSEIIVCIECAIRSQKVDHERVLSTARNLREKTASYEIDDDVLSEAKDAGRP